MHFFKKTKKSRQPSRQPMSLGIPTQIAVGALGISADLDLNVRPRGENDPRGSRIVLRDSSEVLRPRASGSSTPFPEREDGTISTSDSQKQQPPLDLPSAAGREPGVRDQEERKDNETIAERPPEVHTEHGSEGGQGPYEGTPSGNLDATPIPVGGEATRGFGPLKAVLSVVSANYGEDVAVRNTVEGLLPCIVALDERFNSLPGDLEEQRRRYEVIRNLKGIEGQLRVLSDKSNPQQLASAVQDHAEVSGLLEDLREKIFDYQMAHQLAMYEQGCSLINLAEATVLNSFRCARGAGYQHGGRKGCLKGTSGAVLDEIELWTKDFDKLPVYWLNGLAGTGKSTITQTIAERVFADGRLGASFFCSRDFEDRNNLQFIFPTIAIQLARRYTAFRSVFVPLVRSDPDIAHESLYNQMDKLIARPLKKSAISTVIVIDALDECKDEEPASAILSVLRRFVAELSKVKFFLTGRPEARIRDGFRLPLLVGMTDIFVLHEVKSNQVDNDIRLFFKNSFSELAQRRTELDNWPAKAQLDLLCERAAGFFVYAVAAVKFIDRQYNDPRTQLDRLLQYQQGAVRVGQTRFNTNTTLDSLYTSILQEAFGDSTEDDPMIRSVLGTVVLAANPLSPSSIATLLGFDTKDVKPLLSSVPSLLVLSDDINQPIRPFHKSFPDFITNPTRCTSQRYYIPPHHNLEILVSCLNLMNQTLERNMCHLPQAVKNSEVVDLKDRTEEYINHALQYACKSWHKHLVDEPTANRDEITSALHFFLEKKFLCWLEVLSVLGAVRNAVDALKVATKWLEASQTFDLANDCFQFVTGFLKVINTSAPHIYHSALLLCPTESIVQKLYGQQVEPMTRVIQGIPKSWDPSIANKRFSGEISATAWAPCSRFIAVAQNGSSEIVILDAVTLEQLHTMYPPHKNFGWRHITFSSCSRLLTAYSLIQSCFISWDLQTGGLLTNIGTRKDVPCDFVSYSDCETMIGCSFSRYPNIGIIIYNVLSGLCVSSYSIQQSIVTLWTHNEHLKFATVELSFITIWQVSFTSKHAPTKIGSLSAPDNFSTRELVVLPTLSWLAFALGGGILVWDAQHHKILLHATDVKGLTHISFSPGGQFIVCGTKGREFHIWKKTPTGYHSHKVLISGAPGTTPLVSPNGDSVIAYSENILELWHTTSSQTLLPSTLPPSKCSQWSFVEFSPDESLVAVAGRLSSTVTILDINSGNLQLLLDTDTRICGLRITGDKVVIVGDGKIVSWDLSARNSTPDARIDISNSFQTTTFKHPALIERLHASISPSLNYIAFVDGEDFQEALRIYNMQTGEKLVVAKTNGRIPGFASSGHEVWSARDNGIVDQWEIIKENETNTIKLEELDVYMEPQSGFPWHSPYGYQLTDDWWILNSSGKWLLWLPHYLQHEKIQRKWGKRFLVVWNGNSTQVCILKLET